MAPRLPKLPKVSVKVPRVRLPGRSRADRPPPAAEMGQPGLRFIELESRPAAARPAPREAPPAAEALREAALLGETAQPAPPEPVAPPFEPEPAAEPGPAAAPPAPTAPEPAKKKRAFPFGRGQAGAAPAKKSSFTLRRATDARPAPSEEKDVAPKFALKLGRKKDVPAEAAGPAAAPAAAEPRKRLALSFGRKKEPAAAPPSAEAPAAPEAPTPPEAKRGFAFGRRKAPIEASPAEPKRRGFTIGRPKPAKAAAKPEPAPGPVAAKPAEVARPVTALPPPVTFTLPVPPPEQAAPPAPAVAPRAPALEQAELLPQPAPFVAARPSHDFDYMHLRVDRILGDRAVVRFARPADPSAVEERVDDLLAAKAPKARRAKGGSRKGSRMPPSK